MIEGFWPAAIFALVSLISIGMLVLEFILDVIDKYKDNKRRSL
jgi:hypothetical protein